MEKVDLQSTLSNGTMESGNWAQSKVVDSIITQMETYTLDSLKMV